MVATMDTDELLKMLRGKARIPLEDISAEVWVQLLHSVVADLDLKMMKGFRTLADLLPHEPDQLGVKRTVDETLPRIWVGPVGASEEIEHGRYFLICRERSNFPRGWRDVTVKADKVPEVVHAEFLLLARNGKFYLLKTTWVPQVVWGEDASAELPKSFSYHMSSDTKTDLWIKEATDDVLLTWFGEGSQHEELNVLNNLRRACHDTTRHFRAQFASAQVHELMMEGIISRLAKA